jgi:GTPase SAR1 family protein
MLDDTVVIWTEGKTDHQHLKRAGDVLGIGYALKFEPANGADMGDEQLFRLCRNLAMVAQARPTIFIFDRDNPEIVSRVNESGKAFKCWGNNVYSFAIPIPVHRRPDAGVCIELYYTDDEIRTKDAAGRRLFLSTEFNPTSGRHLTDLDLSIGNKHKLSGSKDNIRIVDSEVYDTNHNNVALSKLEFANNVASAQDKFSEFNFTQFSQIFNILRDIVHETHQVDLCFGGFQDYIEQNAELEKPQKLAAITEVCVRAAKLVTMTLAALTIRFYDRIMAEKLGIEPKKIRLIEQVLNENFTTPSLNTFVKLARNCYHLIDDNAPEVLRDMKAMMAENPLLGPIGAMLDDLETIVPPDSRRGRIIDKALRKRPVLEYLLPELAKYETRIAEISESSDLLSDQADPTIWVNSLSMLLELFSPLRSLVYRVGVIDRVHSDTDQFIVHLTTYDHGYATSEEVDREYSDLIGDRLETNEVLVATEGGNRWLNVFPFLRIRGDKLLYYTRTRAAGYEHRSVFGSSAHITPTKRKFNHAALGGAIAADRQDLFWTPVTPAVSPRGVRANIPAQDSSAFVGRKQQIAKIVDEVIEIPNQNGLIFGPGGVGKTALLIELSRKLFDDEIPLTAPPFKNIIWISAKRDYYDPTLNLVEPGSRQFRTLDEIWSTILMFHEFDNVGEYEANDKKWFVLELLREEKTLLVLDNFETVSSRLAQDEIIRFFGVEVKRHLADKPDNCKVMLTSREIIPSGFHQIGLTGLDKRESKSLMRGLDAPYRQSGQSLFTEPQREQIYETTRGIPLIIKHCYGQVFEYSRPLDSVLGNLRGAGNEVMEFSFSEIFKILEEDETQKRIVILLEISRKALLIRQICDILSLRDIVVVPRIEVLARFQCVTRDVFGTDEKYFINPDVQLLATRLVQQFAVLAADIRQRLAGLASEKRLDYTKQEFDSFVIFQQYLANEQLIHAEDFIKEKLKEWPTSILLNLHYAKFLKEIKREIPDAIGRLESIRLQSSNDPSILRLLVAYNTALDFPNFEQAHLYAKELEQNRINDEETLMELAHFYTQWATNIKMTVELDPLKDRIRQQRYRELADHAIDVLHKCSDQKTHPWWYLLAQCQFNKWQNAEAKQSIDKAIAALPKGSHLRSPYEQFRREIVKKWSYTRTKK